MVIHLFINVIPKVFFFSSTFYIFCINYFLIDFEGFTPLSLSVGPGLSSLSGSSKLGLSRRGAV